MAEPVDESVRAGAGLLSHFVAQRKSKPRGADDSVVEDSNASQYFDAVADGSNVVRDGFWQLAAPSLMLALSLLFLRTLPLPSIARKSLSETN